jgi:transketolase
MPLEARRADGAHLSERTPALDQRSLELRRLVIKALEGGGRGHLGSALSLIEILRSLYDNTMRYDAAKPKWPERDRFILSKGHGCLAQYALLADKGFFPMTELVKFCHFDGILGGHPDANKVPGVEASTGALGHGLPIGLGLALAARLQKRDSRVFVVMGDGEINEGSVWEAALCAGKHGLSNLTAIVDYNKLQSYGPTAEVQDLEPLADKWRSFGFSVREVDGHDMADLNSAFSSLPYDTKRPTAVICHTVKGKGVSYAEGNAAWHHKSKISDEEVVALYNELEA